MIFGKTKLEMKVGVFVFISMVILVTFVLSIGGFKTWTSGYQVVFTFDFVNGVKLGAPVRFAGVDVGVVKKLQFTRLPDGGKTQVRALCWVKKEIRIPRDSRIWINTLGLLGEKYLEIMPGKESSNVMQPYETLAGTDPIPMHEITDMARGVVMNIDEAIVKIKNQEGTLGKLLYDDAIYKELEIISRELDLLVTDVRKHPWKLLWKGKE